MIDEAKLLEIAYLKVKAKLKSSKAEELFDILWNRREEKKGFRARELAMVAGWLKTGSYEPYPSSKINLVQQHIRKLRDILDKQDDSIDYFRISLSEKNSANGYKLNITKTGHQLMSKNNSDEQRYQMHVTKSKAESDRLVEQICLRDTYRFWIPGKEELTKISHFLASRYHVEDRLFSFKGFVFPIAVLWSTSEDVDPDELLDPVISKSPDSYAILHDERRFIEEENISTRGNEARNGMEYRMVRIRQKLGKPVITGGLGYWYDHVLSQASLRWELSRAICNNLPLDSPPTLPRRNRFDEEKNEKSILNGTRRCAAMATETLLVIKSDNGKLECILTRRDSTVFQFPNLFHVAPTAMFECASQSDIQGEWSIRCNVEREILEEIFGVIEAKAPVWLCAEQRWESPKGKKLKDVIDNERVRHSMLGLSTELTTLATELSTIFVMKKKDFLEIGPSLNWELKRGGALFELNRKTVTDFLQQYATETVPAGALTLKLGMDWLYAQGYL